MRYLIMDINTYETVLPCLASQFDRLQQTTHNARDWKCMITPAGVLLLKHAKVHASMLSTSEIEAAEIATKAVTSNIRTTGTSKGTTLRLSRRCM